MSKVRIHLIRSYIKSSKKLIPVSVPMILPYMQVESNLESPVPKLRSRQGLDFDFDITPIYPQVLSSFRRGKLALIVKVDAVTLVDLASQLMPEITSHTVGQVLSISFSPPNLLYLGLADQTGSKVALVNLDETFRDPKTISIHYHIKVQGARLISSRANLLAAFRVEIYPEKAELTVVSLDLEHLTVKKSTSVDLKPILRPDPSQKQNHLTLENFCLGLEGIVAFVSKNNPKVIQEELCLQYWKIFTDSKTPSVISSLPVTPPTYSPPKTPKALKDFSTFITNRQSTIVVLQNPTVTTDYAVLQLSGSTLVWLIRWTRDPLLFRRCLDGCKLLASKFWYDAKTERLILAVDRQETSGEQNKSVLFTRLKLV